MTKRAKIVAGLVAMAGLTGLAGAQNLPDDQKLIEKAAAKKAVPAQGAQRVAAPPKIAPARQRAAADANSGADAAAQDGQTEQQARADLSLAQVRLDLVLARKALKSGRTDDAAKRAARVLQTLQTLPDGMDLSIYELQAEGILAKVQRTPGDDITAGDAPTPQSNPVQQVRDTAIHDDLDRRAAAAARISRNFNGADTPDIDTRGDAAALRERTLQNQVPDKKFGYRPSREIIDVDAILERDQQRLHYEGALHEAVLADEARRLTEVEEDRIAPEGWVSYPDNWPQIVAKRAKYKDGVVARTPSWTDKDGREWYVAVYDIHDLIYVPPDFQPPLGSFNPDQRLQNVLDRDALRYRSQIFNGTAEDLAAGLPLLRYFGGVDPYAARGPKYSLERQRQIVDLIERFANPRGAPPQPGQAQPVQPAQP